MRPHIGGRRAAAAASAINRHEAAVHRFLSVAAAGEGIRRRLLLSVRSAYAPMSSTAARPRAAASALTAAASSVLSLAAIGASCAKVSAAGRILGGLALGSERLLSESLFNKFRWSATRPVVLNRQEISRTSSSFYHSSTGRRSITRKKSPDVTASKKTEQLLSSCRLTRNCAGLTEAGTSCVTGRADPAAVGATAAATAASAPVTATLAKATTAVPSRFLLLRVPLAEWLVLKKSRSVEQANPLPVSPARSEGSSFAAAVAGAGPHDVVGTRVAAGGYFFAAVAGGRCTAPTAASLSFGGSTAHTVLADCRRAMDAAFGSPTAFGSAAAFSSAAVNCGAADSASGPADTFAPAVPYTPAAAFGTAAPAATCDAAAAAIPVGDSSGVKSMRVSAEGTGKNGRRGTSCGDVLLQGRRGFASAGAAPTPPSTGAAAETQVQQQDLGLLHAVNIPPLGDSVTRGSVLEWRKKVGDPVRFDEVLCVIETDKVTVEIHSDCEGVVVAHAAAEGESLDVGSQLALIRVADPEAADSSVPAAQSQQEGRGSRLQQDAQQPESQQRAQQEQQQEGTPADVQRVAAGEEEQRHWSSGKQPADKEPAALGEVAAHRGHDKDQAAPAAAAGNAEARTVAAGGEKNGRHSKTRSPSICFRFAKWKASLARGEPDGSTTATTSRGPDVAQQRTGDPSYASVDAAQDEDPLMQLWGVPRWRSLSEEEIESVNLGGAGAGANALGSWKVAVVQMQEKEPQKRRQESKQKQQETTRKQQKATSKQ